MRISEKPDCVANRSISGPLTVTSFGDISCFHAVPNCHVGKHNAGFPCERFASGEDILSRKIGGKATKRCVADEDAE